MRKAITRLWLVLFALVLTSFVFNTWSAPAPEPRWFRVDPSITPGTVRIKIDTTNVPKNIYFENVTVWIGFYNSEKQLLYSESVDFSPRISGGMIHWVDWPYKPRESAVFIKGISVKWGSADVVGGKSDTVGPSLEASSDFIRIPH